MYQRACCSLQPSPEPGDGTLNAPAAQSRHLPTGPIHVKEVSIANPTVCAVAIGLLPLENYIFLLWRDHGKLGLTYSFPV